MHGHASALSALLLAGLMALPSVCTAAVSAPDASGTWQGTYRCGADRTNLTLIIDPSASGGLQAEFVFRVLDGPHRGKQGRFTMLGSYTEAHRRVQLRPSRMIDMPRGFVATPLRGVLSADGAHLTGQVELRGCGEFQVARQTQASGTLADSGAQPLPAPKSAPRAAPRSGSELRQTIFAKMLAHDEAALQWGTGLVAVEQGRAWGAKFRQRHQKSWTDPAVVALYERYLKQRNGALRDARAALAAQFESATESLQLDTQERKFLDRRQDGGLEAGRDVLAVLDRRKQALRDAEERSKFSPGEHALMTAQGRPPLSVPANYPEPAPEDINLAILRELTSAGGRMLSGTAVEVGLPPFDQFMPLRLDTTRVEKRGCRLGKKPRAYSCDYRHFLTVSMPEVTLAALRMGGRSEIVEDMLRKSLEQVNKRAPVVVTHTFVLTSGGWRSPSMHKVVVEGAFKSYAEMLAALPPCELVEEGGKFYCS